MNPVEIAHETCRHASSPAYCFFSALGPELVLRGAGNFTEQAVVMCTRLKTHVKRSINRTSQVSATLFRNAAAVP